MNSIAQTLLNAINAKEAETSPAQAVLKHLRANDDKLRTRETFMHSGESMREADTMQRMRLSIPYPVMQRLEQVGDIARFLSETGLNPQDVNMAAAPLVADASGKLVRGASAALDTMETGKPFVASAWRATMDTKKKDAGHFFFDQFTTPLGKKNMVWSGQPNKVVMQNSPVGGDNIVVRGVTANNPLVTKKNQLELFKERFGRDVNEFIDDLDSASLETDGKTFADLKVKYGLPHSQSDLRKLSNELDIRRANSDVDPAWFVSDSVLGPVLAKDGYDYAVIAGSTLEQPRKGGGYEMAPELWKLGKGVKKGAK